MEAKELRELSAEELINKRAEYRDEIGHLKLKKVTGSSENPMKVRQVKRDLARVETVLREKTRGSGKETA